MVCDANMQILNKEKRLPFQVSNRDRGTAILKYPEFTERRAPDSRRDICAGVSCHDSKAFTSSIVFHRQGLQLEHRRHR